MFDMGIGLFELIVVGLVALVVLGPEKLPGTIRTVGLWIGRLRRSFNTIKRDIEREIGADEIRRQLRNEEIMEKFKHTKGQVQNTIDSVKKEANELRKSADLESQAAAMTSQGSNKSASPSAGTAEQTTSSEPPSPAPQPSTPPTADSDTSATSTAPSDAQAEREA